MNRLFLAAVSILACLVVVPAHYQVGAAGVPFTLVGDANHPGDFLSVLRDASMTGLALGLPSESLPA